MADMSARKAFQDAVRKPVFSLRDIFAIWPTSLREMIAKLMLPPPDLDKLELTKLDYFSESDGQGIAFVANDPAHDKWIIAIKERMFKCKAKGSDLLHMTLEETSLSLKLNDIRGTLGLSNNYNHIGAVEYFDGLIFTPIESKTSDDAPVLLAFDPDLKIVAYAFVEDRGAGDFAFCSLNPFNGLLYTIDWGTNGVLKAYDASAFYAAMNGSRASWPVKVSGQLRRPEKDLYLRKSDDSFDELSETQGAVFSPNGRLYLSRAHGVTVGYENFITIFSSLTGRRIGEWSHDFQGIGDEIEGICYHPAGIIYVSVGGGAPSNWFDIYTLRYSDTNILA